MSILTPVNDKEVSFDKKALSTALGFTQKGFKDRMFNVAFKHIWMDAKRLASIRAFDDKQPLNVTVTDEDLINAARGFLK